MNLTDEQKQQIKAWVEEGRSIAFIQSKMQSEWDQSPTYMDVRFLVDDLGLTLADQEKTPDPSSKLEGQPGVQKEGSKASAEHTGHIPIPFPESEAEGDASAVSVTVDKLQRPGTIVSGSVTFSDGETGGWQLDEIGRLGLVPPYTGYQPNQEDVRQFQELIQKELEQMGF